MRGCSAFIYTDLKQLKKSNLGPNLQCDCLEKLVVEMVKSAYGGKTSSNLNILESERVVGFE